MLPILSKQLKAQDLAESKITQDKAVEYAALLSVPAAVLMIVLARPMINILFEHGRFGASDTLKTSYALIAYAVGLPCYVFVKALMPNFFARGDTITPVKFSAVVFAVNFVFNLMLMIPFGHIGIAVSTTVAAFVSLIQYIYGLKKRGFWCFSKTLTFKVLKIIFASVLMGAVLLAAECGINAFVGNWLALGFVLKFCIFCFLGAMGVVCFFLFAVCLKVLYVKEMLRLFLKRK